ncbi:hypothetical protein BJ165DRAFT_1409892 [Panaeolus papilionaceus]|nr:hypothetical protein BJ165DRAFT_1409892 [Panaeolus papilionaceus]
MAQIQSFNPKPPRGGLQMTSSLWTPTHTHARDWLSRAGDLRGQCRGRVLVRGGDGELLPSTREAAKADYFFGRARLCEVIDRGVAPAPIGSPVFRTDVVPTDGHLEPSPITVGFGFLKTQAGPEASYQHWLWLGLAWLLGVIFGLAWPGFWLQAKASTSLAGHKTDFRNEHGLRISLKFTHVTKQPKVNSLGLRLERPKVKLAPEAGKGSGMC